MSKKKGGLLKFVAGIGLGVGLGMLFAPKKGEELRKDLKVKFDELLNKVKEIDVKEVADDFMDRVNNLKKELEDLDKEKVLELAKKKGEQLKVKATELVDLAKEKIDNTYKLILNADFKINPYIDNSGKYKGCEYCEFADVCYKFLATEVENDGD